MDKKSSFGQIKNRIKMSEKGFVFVASDFNDLTDNVSIRKSLSRLEKVGFIRRIIRGVYDYPEYSDLLKEYIAPSPHRVALALARNYGWTIVPDGDTALNQFGLSTQVPAEWTYVSDGPYKKYSYAKTIIQLNHTANKDISKLSYKSALLVQAIKAIGKDRFDDFYIKRVARLISDDDITATLTEGKFMTLWVYEILKKVSNDSIGA